ncbi:FAD/NAD(P)-binding domain-containing protein [Hymenopellis radicata]|nr:FAD/NAD(P)-binding domain-containing protein [Hymenopellis radicata]
MSKPNIVVVGGSYVGTRMAEVLALAVHETHQIVVIEKNTHFQHLFAFPRFSVVSDLEHRAFIPYDNAFHVCPPGSVTFVSGIAEKIIPGEVCLQSGERIPYEFLIFATGTGTPGPSVPATKPEGMRRLQTSQKEMRRAKHVIVVGGGAYGVQVATDLKELEPTKKVTLIHSRPKLMNRFHPGLHDIVMKRCADLGIDVITGQRIRIPEDGFPNDGTDFLVTLADGSEVSTDYVFQCNGANPLSEPLLSLSPQSVDPKTKFVLVKPTLQIIDERFPKVFSMGDVAETGAHKAARPAYFQADVVVNNIQKLIAKSGEELERYVPYPPGIQLSLASNPAEPDGEPSATFHDEGKLDVGCEFQWNKRAPGVTDYTL